MNQVHSCGLDHMNHYKGWPVIRQITLQVEWQGALAAEGGCEMSLQRSLLTDEAASDNIFCCIISYSLSNSPS